MRNMLMALCLLCGSVMPAAAQISIHIGLPEASIGINLATYPQFVRVPGYPVYYAPRLRTNYFFYDGLYWVYRNDNWYASYWYNGPWGVVAPAAVPVYILRVPVRYYRERPAQFSRWRADAPPRWGEVWGTEWQQQHSGWDRWNRSAVPAPAPLPIYQRQYTGSRYPQVAQQPVLQSQHYRYQPRDVVVQQFYQQQGVQYVPVAPVVRQSSRQQVVVMEPKAYKEPKPPKAYKAPKPPKPPKAYKEPKPPKPAKAYKEPKPPKPAKAYKEPKPPKPAKAHKEPKAPKGHKEK